MYAGNPSWVSRVLLGVWELMTETCIGGMGLPDWASKLRDSCVCEISVLYIIN